MTDNEFDERPPSLPRRAFGVAMPEEQHAHSPYSRAALHCRGTADRRAGLDAGEDVTLAVSQSGRTLMAAASLRAVRVPRSIS